MVDRVVNRADLPKELGADPVDADGRTAARGVIRRPWTRSPPRLLARLPQKIDLSLDRMRALCAALGDPQDRLPAVVHVAGTNGKGSTVAFLRAMAEAAGLRVHVYTSPHLVRFNERIRLAGDLIGTDALNVLLDRVEAMAAPVTVFEATTAAALARHGRDARRSGPDRGGAGRAAGRHQCHRSAAGQRHRPGGSGPRRVSGDRPGRHRGREGRHPQARRPRRHRPAGRRRHGRDRGRGRPGGRAPDGHGPRLRRLARAGRPWPGRARTGCWTCPPRPFTARTRSTMRRWPSPWRWSWICPRPPSRGAWRRPAGPPACSG